MIHEIHYWAISSGRPKIFDLGVLSKQAIEFWEQTQDFHMGLSGGHKIFMWISKAELDISFWI